MRDGLHLERLLGATLVSVCLLVGCPVDERSLDDGEAGQGGESTTPAAGQSGEAGARDGDAGEGGSVAGTGAGAEGGEAGHEARAGQGGADATGARGGSSGSTASGGNAGDRPIACAGAKCSCFEESGDECRDESCCEAPIVAGGDFSLGDEGVSATVADLRLDRYEVTVGRFREFVENYAGPPHPESGQHPWVVASGWRSEWDSEIPADAETLTSALDCDGHATFTLSPGDLDARPVNCVTWFEAFAFCAWDGGRLPTEAEWEYAASGGTLERLHPWGDEAPTDATALFDASELELVGSKPDGAGHYRQLDLAGSVSEWVFDWLGPYADPCTNCALADGGDERVVRGGSYHSDDLASLRSSARASASPSSRSASVGFRCARDL